MRRLIFCVLSLAVLAACSSQPSKEKGAAVEERTPQPVATQPETATTAPQSSAAIGVDPLKDPHSILAKRSVYFDFDSNVVKDEYRPLIQAHARYMVDHADTHIRIEGNCDERGSREYNLALGQRRAEAVKKIMTVLGVSDNRIETISFGEEKPVALGHDEASWAKNRRADIKYAGE